VRNFVRVPRLAVLSLVVASACQGSDAASSEAAADRGEAEAPVAEASAASASEAKPGNEAPPPEVEEGTPPGAGEEVVIDHEVKDIAGETVALSDYRGKALLIVNTASQCGYTPQYANLQKLYGKYKDDGLVVLGFPSNDYGGQEPGTNDEIASFVDDEFGVEFPMMDKLHTKGPEQAPLYATLTEQTPEGIRGEVKWNFTKFLVDPEGKVVARFDTPIDPLSPEVTGAIESVLPAK